LTPLRSLVVAAAITITIASCGGTQPSPSTAATVGIRASGCSLVDGFGTGVAVAPDLVATSAHTIAGTSGIVVIDQAGGETAAQVVGFDPRQDVAILKIDGALEYAPLGSTMAGESGVLATWRPDNGFDTVEVSVTRLLRVTIEDIYVNELTERLALEIATEVTKGDSGSPVFTSQGEVAGIVYAASRERQNVGFVLRASELTALLDSVTGQTVDNGRCP